MAEMQISQEDINGLAQTLDELNLPAGQKALLSALFTVAAHAIGSQEPLVSVEVVDPLPSFHDQFAAAFTPGQVNDLGHEAGGAVGVRVSTALSNIGRSHEP